MQSQDVKYCHPQHFEMLNGKRGHVLSDFLSWVSLKQKLKFQLIMGDIDNIFFIWNVFM